MKKKKLKDPNSKNSKTYKITLEFDSKDSAHSFFAHWLDGGGDGGGNMDWNTTEWFDYHYMRIEGTGDWFEV